MIYETNFGVISHFILPEESISWSVPDLISIKESTEHVMISSPWFSYHGEIWCLALTVRYWKGTQMMGFFLWRKHPGKNQYEKVTLTMELNHPVSDFIREISGRLNSFGSFGEYSFLGMNRFKTCPDKFLFGGRMNFTCKIKKHEPTAEQISSVQETSEIEVSEESSNENNTDEVPKLKGTDRLIENLKSLCLDGRHSDFLLRVDGREFRVHKGILGARSPVFAAMFEHDMEETKKDKVDIPDCVASAFEIFLLYLYTGYAENLSKDNIFDVYYAADKYRVDDLKAECLEFMKSTLSVNSFCDVIALSVRHNEKVLLREATCFFTENIKEIIKTVHWQKFITENPIQANELFIKALN